MISTRTARPVLTSGVAAFVLFAAVLSAQKFAVQPGGAPLAPAKVNGGPAEVLGADAIPDLIVSPSAGAIVSRVLSGANGAELASGFPFGPAFVGGVRIAAGDLNGDGVADIVAAMGPGGGLVTLLDGNNAAVLGSGYPFGTGFAGGVSVAVGDINGDGRNDIVAAPATGGGTVFAVNGIDYSLLFAVAPFGGGYAGGMNVATGDVDGDGRADIIVGQSNGGVAAIIGAATQAVTASAVPFGNVNGVFVAAGDVNNDGRAEVIAAPGSGNGPVLIYDAAAQALLAAPVPYPAGFSGGVRVAATDLTGDGRVEIITAPGPGIAPVLKIYDGATFANTSSIPAYPDTFASGTFIAAPATAGIRFTSAAATSFAVGTAGSFTVRTGGTPAVTTISRTGTLPSGVTFTNNGNGTATLSGTPAAGTGGTYALTLTATNNVSPPVVQAFTLTVNQTPAITSGSATTFAPGTAGSFSVTTTGFPRPTLTATGALPAGVTFTDNGNGSATLGGTPANGSGGSYPISITASNGVGSAAVQSFTLSVNGASVFTSAAAASFRTGVAGTFSITTSGVPTAAITFTGTLPTGLSIIDNGNGTATLAGTPSAGTGGTYALTVQAANGVGAPATQNFVLAVTQAPAITSANATAFTLNLPGTFTATTTGFPAPSLSATGALPTGVTFVPNSNGTATLSGTAPTGTSGNYPLVITASNGIGSAATQNFTLTITSCAAVTVLPASGPLAGGTFNTAYSQTFTASGGGSGHTFAVTGGSLPAGLMLAAGGGLTGSPTTTGTFNFTVTATATNACAGSAGYTLVVAPNAQAESYSNGVGNTQYSVGGGTPATPAVVVAGTVLTNDSGPGSLTVGPASIASTNGGQVTMASNGTFILTPAVGFAGPSDTFTYTLTDGNGATDTAVVTINMSGVVWYVNASAGAGDGRSQAPFSTMTAAAAASLAGQTLYVHSGAPAGASVLKASQALQGAGEAFVLNGLSIAASAAPTLQGTITLANGATVRALTVNAGGSDAIVATGLSGSESLTNVTITGGTTGLNLTNLAGTLAVTGGAISGITPGSSVSINGGTGTIGIGSSITTVTTRSVSVQNRTAGTVTFSGAITDTGPGILLNTNTGSTIAFTGGLALTTGANPAFVATGGGTVTATQNNTSIVNTLSTTTATALNVANTAIGAAGLTFRSISAGTSNYSPGVGIALDHTGVAAANGGLSVVGDGTPNSGGFITRKSGVDGSTTSGIGIALDTTKNASFSRMNMSDFENAAIMGRDVSGFALDNSLLFGVLGDSAGSRDGALVFGVPNPSGVNGVTGTVVIRDNQIYGSSESFGAFYNQSGSLTLTIDGASPVSCQFNGNSSTTGGDGLLFRFQGTAVATIAMNRCRVRDARAAAVRVLSQDDATVTIDVADSELVNSFQGTQGLVLVNSTNADLTASVTSTDFIELPGANVWLGQASGNASALSKLHVTIVNNAFTQSPGATDRPIVVSGSSTTGSVAPLRVLVDNNFIQSPVLGGIYVVTPDALASPRVDLTLANNHVDTIDTVLGTRGVTLDLNQGSAAVCASVTGNTFHHLPPTLGAGLHLTQAGSTTVSLERGSANLADPVTTVLQANNPSTNEFVVSGTVGIIENGVCLVPTP